MGTCTTACVSNVSSQTILFSAIWGKFHAVRVNRISYTGTEWILNMFIEIIQRASKESWPLWIFTPGSARLPTTFSSKILSHHTPTHTHTHIYTGVIYISKALVVAKLPDYMLHSWGQWNRDRKSKDFKHQIKEEDTAHYRPEGHDSDPAACTHSIW